MQAGGYCENLRRGMPLDEGGRSLLGGPRRKEQRCDRPRRMFAVSRQITLGRQIRIGAPDGCANFVWPQVCARSGGRNSGA